ncbi:DUF4250 domain-containing protein [Clostridium sp. 19966]|nr:DUF4250 domain-containing protein [Clostridium sp. 19966]
MDPFMLLSIINMKLRDQYSSLQDYCEDLDVGITLLTSKLESAGYKYSEEKNQFTAV